MLIFSEIRDFMVKEKRVKTKSSIHVFLDGIYYKNRTYFWSDKKN